MRPGEHNLLRRAARTWPFIRSRAPRPRRSASPSPHRHAQKRLALRRFETRLSTQTFTLGGSRVKRLTRGGESFFESFRLHLDDAPKARVTCGRFYLILPARPHDVERAVFRSYHSNQ